MTTQVGEDRDINRLRQGEWREANRFLRYPGESQENSCPVIFMFSVKEGIQQPAKYEGLRWGSMMTRGEFGIALW